MHENKQDLQRLELYICTMQKHHIIAASIAFLMCALSAYYGIRIWDDNQNHLITELNEFDKVYHDDIKDVPAITAQAVIVTSPFLLTLIVLELLIIRKTTVKQIKNIAYGLLLAALIILTVAILSISDPAVYDFSKWGFVWICLGLFLLVGNLLSFFIYRFSKSTD